MEDFGRSLREHHLARLGPEWTPPRVALMSEPLTFDEFVDILRERLGAE
jgi:hypothetical protein